ncbi:hypothetical protein [Falsibacillus albus]|uniref:SCP2 domain-containing protein n=1 Tax=Falsibacillus albus TaxID=2478915 RepID=A0A3L7K0I4_9BACI|nr:hypothetical protein [Falsibacillus albus]RLQ96556.1 hypothetical protein D9X91_05475 [Falsibacillus albus]
MQTLFDSISKNFQERRHIQTLMPKDGLTVVFHVENHKYLLTIGNSKLYFEEVLDSEFPFSIWLTKRAFMELLCGELQLMKLLKRDGWLVKGSFRNLLLLESVLWLCRDYSSGEIDKTG